MDAPILDEDETFPETSCRESPLRAPVARRRRSRYPRAALRPRSSKELLGSAVVFVVAVLVYANAMPAVAIHDDAYFVPARHPLTADALRRIFSEDAWAAAGARSGLYRPLAILSIALDGAVWGDAADAYHRTNVLLHALASVVVLAFLRALQRGASAWPAAVGAVLFAVHPIHSEAVDSVFNRSELLSTIFVIGALTLVARARPASGTLRWSLVALAFLLALLCRESAIAMPLLVLLVLWLAAVDGGLALTLERLAPLSLLVFPAGVYFVLRSAALAGAPQDPSPFFGVTPPAELLPRLFYALCQLAEYARMLVWPWPLRVSYEDFAGESFRAAIGAHGALLVLALATYRRAPLVTFGVGFFYAALLPVTQLFASAGAAVKLGPWTLARPALPLLVNERVAYMPSVALCLLVAVGVAALARRLGVAGTLACAALPIAASAWITWQRNPDWHDAISLYEAEVAAAPANGDGWRHLIGAYSSAGKVDAAARACDAQLGREQRSAYFFINCGSIYFQLGRDEAAIGAYRRAIELGLASVGHMNLGRVYAKQGRLVEAESHFATAARVETQPLLRHFRRGQWLARFHPERRAEAIAAYRAALALQPDYAPARRALDALLSSP
jgi:tetratricopeptide (TPR) repeat protein